MANGTESSDQHQSLPLRCPDVDQITLKDKVRLF